MTSSAAPVTVMAPGRGGVGEGLQEAWRHRELLYFLVWRDVKVRFKQTILGGLWVILRPLLNVAMFTVVFGRLARLPSDGLPYSLFVFSGILPWTFFSAALTAGSLGLVGNAHLISKVYFPRILLPVSAIVSNLIETSLSFLVLFALMAKAGIAPPLSVVLTLPAVIGLVLVLSFGLSLWMGALNVRYRDIGNILPFLLQVWMYATPIVYPLHLVPEKYRWLVMLNPVSGVVGGFRSALFGRPWDLESLFVSGAFAFLFLVSGLKFFRKAERTFADRI